MKGIEKMIAHISADAEKKADAVLAQAERQCSEIRQDYERRAREAYTEKIRAGVRDSQARLEDLMSLSRSESEKGLLSEKQALVDECFALAVDKLAALPEEEYRALLTGLALKAPANAEAELIFNEGDRLSHGEAVAKAANEKLGAEKLRLSEACGSFKGGFVLKNGSGELSFTLETLAEGCREELAQRVASTLFD